MFVTVVASDSREKKKATGAAFPSMGRRFKCVNRTVRVHHTALGAFVTVCLCVSVCICNCRFKIGGECNSS